MTRDAELQEQRAIREFLTEPGEEEFRVLFGVFYEKILRYFRIRGMDSQSAEELGQNVFLKVFQRVGDLRDPDYFRAWLFKIARNELLQHRRKHSHDVETINYETDSAKRGYWTEPAPVRSQQWRFLDWMASIDGKERQILMLRYIEGLDYQEIATVLSLPLGTVKWRIFRAKQALIVLLGKSLARKT